MKKGLLALIMCALFASNISAQCIPDTSITHGYRGIYPDTIVNLPHAIVGIPYSTVIQMHVFPDTTSGGFTYTTDHLDITSVNGLPLGYTYSCTPASCQLPGGADVCILLQGPAPTPGQVGMVYPIVVGVDAYLRLFGQQVPPQSGTVVGYRIAVDDNVGIASLSRINFDVAQNTPNPFSNTSQIDFSSPSIDNVVLKISDLLGNVVYTKQIIAQRGINKIILSAKDFASGIYVYTLSNSRSAITKRMIISNE